MITVLAVVFICACEEPETQEVTEVLTVSTLAGSDIPGLEDGVGASARFNHPCGMAADPAGNLYVADQYNNCIRKITVDGAVTTFAGTGVAGFDNGHVSTATFNSPYGLAIDADGNIYVGDVNNHAIRKISADGVVSTLAGGQQGFSDRDGTVARFNHPHGVAVDAEKNVYVADAYNNRIRKITPEGLVSTVAGNGNDGFLDGNGLTAEFYVPIGIAVDAEGNLYVGDEGNSSIRKIAAGADVTTLAGNGKFSFSDGMGKEAEFNAPGAIAIDASGNLYIADYFNNCIREVTPAGMVTKIAGNLRKGFADGPPSEAQFHYPFGIAIDPSGILYVGDQFNHRIRKIQ